MQLAHTHIRDRGDIEPTRWMVFLHGILGRRANWRGFARRSLASRPGWGALLVDMREHGDSQGFTGPHTIDAAAGDVVKLIDAEAEQGRLVAGVLGHSFGGKVALAAASTLASRPDDTMLSELWIVDSPLGAGGRRGLTSHVMDVLEELPPRFADRGAFLAALDAAGLETGTSQWLAMNLQREPDGLRFALDMRSIRALIDDFYVRDLWPAIESSRVAEQVNLVLGGQSSALSKRERARAEANAQAGRARLCVVAEAGHWVHVDDPSGLLACMSRA